MCAQGIRFQKLRRSSLQVHCSFALGSGQPWKLCRLNYGRILVGTLFTRKMKMLSRCDGFKLYGKLGVDLFSTFELLYPNMKNRLGLIRARHIFYMISDNPNNILGFVDESLYLVALLSRMNITKKQWTSFLWSWTNWKLLQRLPSFLPDKTSSFEKTFSTKVEFIGLPLKWIQTLH